MQKIQKTNIDLDVSEVGEVIYVGDGVSRIQGLENVLSSELLEFPNNVFGMAMNLEENSVGAVLFGDSKLVKEGDIVKRTGKVVQVGVGKDLDIDISGKNILIVEDIFDTGLTLSYLKKILDSRNPKSLEFMCMFIKDTDKTTSLDIKYHGFKIGPEFVVGYGLDFEGKYRELPYLAVLS